VGSPGLERNMTRVKVLATIMLVALAVVAAAWAQLAARDPGVRSGPSGAGGMLPGLTAGEQNFFRAGKAQFEQLEQLADGLGPRFNLDSCVGCHAQPATGGTSPATNPQVAVATAGGARNTVPFFLRPDGPVREVRFRNRLDGSGPDGGVHDLFVISGRSDGSGVDATGCGIRQEDFNALFNPFNPNLIFRIPTPVFGAGLIEQISDAAIVANQRANAFQKNALGIGGRAHQINTNGNDGTIARFGWKAQNKSLLLFAGEAYNVEIGITNELFQTERDETPSCQLITVPNNVANTDGTGLDFVSDIEKFAFFMRFLAPPKPSPDTPGGAASIARGQALFATVGCALCHTPTLATGATTVAALQNQQVNLFSDLLLHHMGPKLADGIAQGQAQGDEFRTAPLWGLGQRLFFLHDGRATNLLQAIFAHYSDVAGTGELPAPPSEANAVILRFLGLGSSQQQDLINFLRSL